MAKKKPETPLEYREQFSKRLARWTSVFWFFYMVYVTAAMAYEPQVAQAGIWLAGFTTAVMMLNVYAYTKNSTYEKALIYTERIMKARYTKKEEEETEIEEEGDNG